MVQGNEGQKGDWKEPVIAGKIQFLQLVHHESCRVQAERREVQAERLN
jgi:hypothetical protein